MMQRGSVFYKIYRSAAEGRFFLSVGSRCKDVLSRLVYGLWYRRLPIQENKIVFDNYMGRGFGCNPKYVAKKLLEDYPGRFELVWLVSRADMAESGLPPQIRAVPYESLRAVREYATAKVWISNHHKVFFLRRGLRKRAGQYFIQLWHGTFGIKKLEKQVPYLLRDRWWLRWAQASSRMTDYWISNSAFLSREFKDAFWDVRDESILLYGSPKNDVFFDETGMGEARRRIERRYGVAGKKLLLYVPTFREDLRLDCYDVDSAGLREHLGRRFGGEWVVLVRLHPRMRELPGAAFLAADTVDVTGYLDVQDLLVAADCVLTDYSSCIFDFMFTRRPAFLFAADLDAFEEERGLCYPLESTPFPLARTNAELMENIDRFDAERYRVRLEAFLRDKGSVDDGRASERVAALAAGLAGGNEQRSAAR